ncbi:BA14K family protein [Roseibium sediminicola]|uniref:BA14K family protein n=1 Tax=Roseibium sediminicola TaxID=2933272 RepID=UPI003CE474AB
MFRKTFLKATALAIVTATVAAAGVSTASAGGYGYNSHKSYNNYNTSGYGKAHSNRPFAHIQDHIWQKHVSWCHNRFKSFKTYDNTYQPYNGPRAQCWSPYISG